MTRPTFKCLHCGVDYSPHTTRPCALHSRKFCSRNCAALARRLPLTVFELQAKKLAQKVLPPLPNGCILYSGRTNGSGYGLVTARRQGVLAHRLSYAIHKGDPAGMFVCHSCDTPLCVNPDHLWLGTTEENTADMVSKGRQRGRRAKGKPDITDDILRKLRGEVLGGMTIKRASEKYDISGGFISLFMRGLNRRLPEDEIATI